MRDAYTGETLFVRPDFRRRRDAEARPGAVVHKGSVLLPDNPTETTPLTQLSDALAEAVQIAARSTVLVNARRRFPATGVAWSADGLVVTANHVVERDDEIGILLPDETETSATLVGRDPRSDLALLRVENAELVPAERVAADTVKVGQIALAIGWPRPGSPMASFGVVSAFVNRRRRRGDGTPLIRPDLVMYPGFSGGPLVNVSGQVIGINSSHLGRDGGMTVPSETVDRVVSALSRDGRVRRAYLGVASQPARLATEIEGSDRVLLVVMVEAGSPAANAGLLVGDSIVAIDGARLRSADDLQAALDAVDVGSRVSINIVRGGESVEVQVEIGERA